MKSGNNGGYLLPYWKIVCNDKNNRGELQKFIKSTKSSSPTDQSGAISIPPMGTAFMYTETSSNNHDNNVFVSFERTDIIPICIIAFYYNRFSILTNDSLKSMGGSRFQLLLEDITWSTRYNVPKKIDKVIHQLIGLL